jgi:hypothetical protein
MKQSTYPMMTARAYYFVVTIRLWVLKFSLRFDYFHFHHSLVNVIERRIHFAE